MFSVVLALPFLAPLLAAGALEGEQVERIIIDRINVFNPAKPGENKPPYTWVNKLHIITRELVIRREILLEQGELFDPYLKEQSERNLRDDAFLKGVHIAEKRSRPGFVDLNVVTQDSWTTEISPSIGRSGGRSSWGLLTRERNFLGWGKTVEFVYNRGFERLGKKLRYVDPRLMGSRFALDLSHSNLSDGFETSGSLSLPRYSLTAPLAMEMKADRLSRDERLYAGGLEVLRYRRRLKSFIFFAGRPLRSNSRRALGHGFGYRVRDDVYTSSNSASGLLAAPPSRKRHVLETLLSFTEADYLKEDFIEAFDRVQDFNLGLRFSLRLGYAARDLGSTENEALASLHVARGVRLGEGHFAEGAGGLVFRYPGSQTRDIVQSFNFNYYKKHFALPFNTLVIHAETVHGLRLADGLQVLLGGNNGLRGYKFNAFAGSKSLLFNVENRWFVLNDFLRLVSLAPVVFWDMGYVWPSGAALKGDDLKHDIGVGLRLGMTRSAVNPVIRFDVSHALNKEGASADGWLFSFGIHHAFGSANNSAGNVFSGVGLED